MKNKIAKKLIFSAVALGASVLTLTTTTYAWYVQNNTVTATNITGSTKSNDAGSLFITKDGSVAVPTWGPTIKFEDSDFTSAAGQTLGNAKGDLTPLKLLDTNNLVNSFSDVSGTRTVEEGTAPDTTTVSISKGKVITVNFWLMSSKPNVTVQPTLQIKNTTGQTGGATKVSQTAYSAVKGNATWKADATRNPDASDNVVEQGAAFWVDAVQALRMSVVATPDGSAAGTPSVYDVKAIAKSMDDKNVDYALAAGSIDEDDLGDDTIMVGTEQHTYQGAHAFYQRFVGSAPTAGFTAAVNASTTWSTFSLGTTKTKYTITFWLEGTDISCFDSCASQSFELAFDFTVVSA